MEGGGAAAFFEDESGRGGTARWKTVGAAGPAQGFCILRGRLQQAGRGRRPRGHAGLRGGTQRGRSDRLLRQLLYCSTPTLNRLLFCLLSYACRLCRRTILAVQSPEKSPSIRNVFPSA